MLSGPADGEGRRVTSNDPNTLTVAINWYNLPSSGVYSVINTSTFTVVNDVSGDNKNADGETKITWNLQ
jgi:hypothetical protein